MSQVIFFGMFFLKKGKSLRRAIFLKGEDLAKCKIEMNSENESQLK